MPSFFSLSKWRQDDILKSIYVKSRKRTHYSWRTVIICHRRWILHIQMLNLIYRLRLGGITLIYWCLLYSVCQRIKCLNSAIICYNGIKETWKISWFVKKNDKSCTDFTIKILYNRSIVNIDFAQFGHDDSENTRNFITYLSDVCK